VRFESLILNRSRIKGFPGSNPGLYSGGTLTEILHDLPQYFQKDDRKVPYHTAECEQIFPNHYSLFMMISIDRPWPTSLKNIKL